MTGLGAPTGLGYYPCDDEFNYSTAPVMVCASCGGEDIRWNTDSYCYGCGEFRDAISESDYFDSLESVEGL